MEGLTDQDLRERYDEANESGQPFQSSFFLDELRRRESRRSEATMRHLTWVIAGLTLVNVARCGGRELPIAPGVRGSGASH